MAPEFVVGAFKSESAIVAAAGKLRAQGRAIHDAYTPFPVHGLDEAMGLQRSILPYFCFAFGLSGLATALGFQLWSTVVYWPMNIGGKSFSAVPALIPIGFELTVLFAALGSVATLFALRGLSPMKTVDFSEFGSLNDRFVLVLRAKPGEASQLSRDLSSLGADKVQEVSAR